MELWCPECAEPAQEYDVIADGSMLSVDAERLRYAHLDGEPLCPVMTSKGYQPALPVKTKPKEES